MPRTNSITVCMWDDVATAAAAEYGEYERTGDNMRELEYDVSLTGILQAADHFVWWVKSHIGRHDKPSIDARLRFDYVNNVIYCEDGDEDYTTGETEYRRVVIHAPGTFTQRQRLALNAAIERAFNRE